MSSCWILRRVKTHPMNSIHMTQPGHPQLQQDARVLVLHDDDVADAILQEVRDAGAAAAEAVAERILPNQVDEADRLTLPPMRCGDELRVLQRAEALQTLVAADTVREQAEQDQPAEAVRGLARGR